MTDADTAPVQIAVSSLTPVSGRGEIRYVASVTLDIGGVEVVLDAWTLRMDKAGCAPTYLPIATPAQARGPRASPSPMTFCAPWARRC